MSRGWLCHLLLLLPLTAQAHGPTPAGADVVIIDGDRAQAVKMTRGAAVHLDGEWRYVCQSRWGGPDAPTMLDTGDGTALLPAVDGLRHLAADGTVSPTPWSQLTSSTTRQLLLLKDTPYALTGFSGGSTLWRLSGPEPTTVYESDRTIKSVATDGDHFLLAWVTDEKALELLSVDPAGQPLGAPTLVEGPFEGTIVLAPLKGRLYVRTLSSSLYRLYELAGQARTLTWESEEPIHGPVPSGEAILAALDRSLYRIDGPEPVLLDDERRLTCLHARGALGAVACVLPDIRPVDAEGHFGQPIFALSGLKPPITGGLDEESRTGCQLDWLDLATDAGLPVDSDTVDTGPEPVEPTVAEAPETPPTEGGCQASPRPAPPSSWLTLLALLLVCRPLLKLAP